MAMYFLKGLAGFTRASWCQVVSQLMAGAVIVLMVGCKAEPEPPEPPPPPQPLTEAQRVELETFQKFGEEQFRQLSACNKMLLTLTQKFLARVSASLLADVQQQLADCVSRHNSVRLLLPFSAQLQLDFYQLHSQIHSRVSLPGYIDSLPNHPNSGIVHDHSLELNRTNLRAQQFLSGDQEVALGYGVLVQLLEQPLSRIKAIPPLPGVNYSEDLPNNRRRQYLQLLLEVLVTDSGKLSDLWHQQPLPAYQHLAFAWHDRQLKRLATSLSKKPVDLSLAQQIHRWIEQGSIPPLNKLSNNRPHPDGRPMVNLLKQLNMVSTRATQTETLSQ